MVTELPVVTSDTEYWHAGCYMEEICAKPQFPKFILECGVLFTAWWQNQSTVENNFLSLP